LLDGAASFPSIWRKGSKLDKASVFRAHGAVAQGALPRLLEAGSHRPDGALFGCFDQPPPDNDVTSHYDNLS